MASINNSLLKTYFYNNLNESENKIKLKIKKKSTTIINATKAIIEPKQLSTSLKIKDDSSKSTNTFLSTSTFSLDDEDFSKSVTNIFKKLRKKRHNSLISHRDKKPDTLSNNLSSSICLLNSINENENLNFSTTTNSYDQNSMFSICDQKYDFKTSTSLKKSFFSKSNKKKKKIPNFWHRSTISLDSNSLSTTTVSIWLRLCTLLLLQRFRSYIIIRSDLDSNCNHIVKFNLM
jgi:hypothetical protein